MNLEGFSTASTVDERLSLPAPGSNKIGKKGSSSGTWQSASDRNYNYLLFIILLAISTTRQLHFSTLNHPAVLTFLFQI
jgi:hypothetical protein